MKETKTVQVYPSDDVVNATIEEYEGFGWEVIGNQRCQEFEGTTYGIDGSSTRHYSTFNKITFSRDKDAAWYGEVSELEREYNVIGGKVKSYKNYKPVLRKPQPDDGAVAFALGLVLYFLFLVPGIIYTVVRCCLKAKYKKDYEKSLAEYNAVYPEKIKELSKKQKELRARAQKCICG